MDTLPVVPLLNLPLHNVSFDDFLHQLEEGVVFTPNVDHFMKVQKDEAFYRLYQQADYRVCDSRIVQLVSRWLDQPSIVEQIAGSDFFPAYCFFHRHHTDRVRVFLLGGREGAGRMAMENLNRKTQSQIIVGYDTPPMGFEQDPAQRDRIIAKIKASGATVLAVGLGAPKQEKWIMAHKHLLPEIKIFFAIGATIDFQAGARKRAPKWLTKMGLEWAHRLAQEPFRLFRRYLLEDLPFFWLIARQKWGMYQNPWPAPQTKPMSPASNSLSDR